MGNLQTNRNNQFRIAKEATWGVATTPTDELKVRPFSASLAYDNVEDPTLTGSRVAAGNIQVSRMGRASIPISADPVNLAWFLAAVLGKDTTSADGSGYAHLFELLDSSTLPFFTGEVSGADGVVDKRLLDMVAESLSIEIQPKQIIAATAAFIYTDEADGGPTSLTPTTLRPFVWGDINGATSVQVDASNFRDLKSLNLNIANNPSTDDYRAGLGGVLASIPAGKFVLSGTMVVPWNSDTEFLRDKRAANETFALEVVVDTGIEIGAGPETYALTIVLNDCQIGNLAEDLQGDFAQLTVDFAQVSTDFSFTIRNARATAYV